MRIEGKKIYDMYKNLLSPSYFKSNIIFNVSSSDIIKDKLLSQYLNKKILIEFSKGDEYKHNNGGIVKYSKIVEKYKIISSPPYLIFFINRISQNVIKRTFSKNIKDIIPDEEITLAGNLLHLSSIVIHDGSVNGGHYTSYIKIMEVWYFYNDMNGRLQNIGTYTDLPRTINTHGTIYFYT